MLSYSLRDLVREPRRTLASVLGVALGVGLFSAILLFIDAATTAMTARALAPLPVDMQAVVSEPLTSTVDVTRLRSRVAAVRGIASADTLSMIDLPPGALRDGDAPTSRGGVRVFAFEPSYLRHDPSVHVTAGSFAPGTALLSVEAARTLGAHPGDTVTLDLPGAAQPLGVRVGGLADLSAATSLFSSRIADTLGDFIYVPDTVVLSPDVFDGAVMPALRADAASASPVLHNSPIVEVDALVDRGRLAADPGTALSRTQAMSGELQELAPGQVFVVDSDTMALALARGDAATGRVMFLLLGLPGVLLAAFLAAYAGGLLAQAMRRENAILRTRGAHTGVLVRVLLVKAVVVAGLGSVLGLGLGVVSLLIVSGSGALRSIPGGDVAWVGLVSLLAGVLTTALALVVPGRRALRREVLEEGRELEAVHRPVWQRLWLDAALLAVAVAAEIAIAVDGGLTPVQVEGASVSLSLQLLLPPLLAWWGATLLAVRLLLTGGAHLPVGGAGGYARLVGGTLGRTLRRRPRALASGVAGVGLSLAFGFGIVIFVSTYDARQTDEARFTVGADLRVTPSVLSPQPAAFASRLRVPGVVSASPVDFHIADATFGDDTKDLAAIDATTLGSTATMADAFFLDGGAAASMARMRADPAALLVDAEMAHDFGIHPGDPVRLRLTDSTGGQVTATFHAAGRYTQFPGFPQHADIVANIACFERATGLRTADFFLVRTADPSDAGVARVVAELRSTVSRDVPLAFLSTAMAINSDQSTLAALDLRGLGSLDALYTALMSATAIGIFVFGLLLQRRREYVTLRALGIRDGQLQALLLGEAGVVALCGLAIALPIGVGMAYLLVQVLRPLFTLPADRLSFPIGGMSALAALVLATMALSALGAGVLLRRLKPMQLLREE